MDSKAQMTLMESEKQSAIDAIDHLQIDGDLVSLERFGPGHIHTSFRAIFGPGASPTGILLQKVNRHVFKHPEVLMSNLETVTRHQAQLQSARHPDDWRRRTLQIVAGRDGQTHYVNADNEWWRAFVFVERTRTVSTLGQDRTRAQQAGAAFGQFQDDLDTLHRPVAETIAGFHDFSGRLRDFEVALRSAPENRLKSCRKEVKQLRGASALESELASLRQQLPTRVVHNDAKLENLLFDARTGECLCVVDLDTVMAGLALFDFGELLRSAAVDQREDDGGDSLGVEIDWGNVEQIARGFVASAHCLTDAERSSLALGPILMSCENSLRFLTDHLQGDVYFRIHRPNHNLDRCRAQLQRLDALTASRDRLTEILVAVCSEEDAGLTD